MTNEITKAFRGVDPSANRGMEMPADGIHFTLDRSYAAAYGEVVTAEITMGRNLNLMAIESAADFVARFAAVGIAADAVVGEFIDGTVTVADIASDWENAGPECLMGEDFTNFLGRHVRHAVDTITFPENAVEEDPAIIVLNLENISR
jgi:hypothetical protein